MQSRPPREAAAPGATSRARYRTLPKNALPSMLNSSKTARSPFSTMSRRRTTAGLPAFSGRKLNGPTPQARWAVVAPYFIWKDAVPVGEDRMHVNRMRWRFRFSFLTPLNSRSVRSRRARTSARTVVDLPEPAPPVKIMRNGFVRRSPRRRPPSSKHASRSSAFRSAIL